MRSKYLISIVAYLVLSSLQQINAQTGQPTNVRDYFMLLPQEYFAIESCNTDVEKDCRPFKEAYIKRFLTVADSPNGYIEGDGDGAQERFKMVLFQRPDGIPVIGLNVYGEFGERYYFLEYKDQRWRDVSRLVIPNYKKSYVYQLPREGTTIEVFERIDFDPEIDQGELGRKLCELIWKNGRFTVKRN